MKAAMPSASPPSVRGAAHTAWTLAAALGLVGAAVLWLMFNAVIALVTRD